MPEDKTKPQDQQELEVVDITSAALPKGLEAEIDPSEDAWEFGSPPPKGTYPFKLGFQVPPPRNWKKGIRDGYAFFATTLECRIALEGDYEGAASFLDIRTSIRRGKHISTAASLIYKCGFKIKQTKLDDLTVARLVSKLIAQGPTIIADADWEAYSATDERTILRGMDKFPELPDGSKDHVVKDSKGNECFARLRITKIYSKGEEHPPFGPAKAGAAAAKAGAEEIDLTPANTTARVAPPAGKQAAQVKAEPSPGEEVELLEE